MPMHGRSTHLPRDEARNLTISSLVVSIPLLSMAPGPHQSFLFHVNYFFREGNVCYALIPHESPCGPKSTDFCGVGIIRVDRRITGSQARDIVHLGSNVF